MDTLAEISSFQGAGIEVAVGVMVALLGVVGTLATKIILNRLRVPRLRSKLYRSLAEIHVATNVCLETVKSGNKMATKTLLDGYVTPSTLKTHDETLHSLHELKEAGPTPRAEFEAFQALVDRLIAIKERKEVGIADVMSVKRIFDENLEAKLIDAARLKRYSEPESSFAVFVALRRFLVYLGFLEKQRAALAKLRDDLSESTAKVNSLFDDINKADKAVADLMKRPED